MSVRPSIYTDVDELAKVSLAKLFQRNGILEDKRPTIIGEQLEGAGNRKADRGLVDLLLISCGKGHALAKAGGVFWHSFFVLRCEDVS